MLFEAGDEGVGADRDLDVFTGAAVERHTVDSALEVDGHAIAALGLGALAFRSVGAVLVRDPLDRLVDIGLADLGNRLLDLKTLEIGELDRRHHLDRNRVGEIRLSRENLLDLFLLRRHRDLRFGRKAEAALGEDLRIGITDGLVDGLGHDGAAIDLLQMAHRHLARAEAVEPNLVLEVDETRVRLGIEIRCRNIDLEFVLQSLVEGFGDLHGVHLLPRSSRPMAETLSKCSARGPEACASGSANRNPQSREKVLQNSSGKR